MTQKTTRLTQTDLRQFIGTEHWYRHALMRSILFTDGAKYVADKAGAYWLLDEIAFAQADQRIAAEKFQLWKLRVHSDKSATLICEDGDCKSIFTKPIGYTDFPLEEICFYFIDNVILLPSEY